MLYKFSKKNRYVLEKFQYEYIINDTMEKEQLVSIVKKEINNIILNSTCEFEKIEKIINVIKRKCNLENDYGLEIYNILKEICELVDREILTEFSKNLNVNLNDINEYLCKIKKLLCGNYGDDNVIKTLTIQNKGIIMIDGELYINSVKERISKRSEKKIMISILTGLCEIMENENNIVNCKKIRELINYIKKGTI